MESSLISSVWCRFIRDVDEDDDDGDEDDKDWIDSMLLLELDLNIADDDVVVAALESNPFDPDTDFELLWSLFLLRLFWDLRFGDDRLVFEYFVNDVNNDVDDGVKVDEAIFFHEWSIIFALDMRRTKSTFF